MSSRHGDRREPCGLELFARAAPTSLLVHSRAASQQESRVAIKNAYPIVRHCRAWRHHWLTSGRGNQSKFYWLTTVYYRVFSTAEPLQLVCYCAGDPKCNHAARLNGFVPSNVSIQQLAASLINQIPSRLTTLAAFVNFRLGSALSGLRPRSTPYLVNLQRLTTKKTLS